MKSEEQKEHSKEMYNLGYNQCKEDILKMIDKAPIHQANKILLKKRINDDSQKSEKTQ